MWYNNVGTSFILSQSTRLTDRQKHGRMKERPWQYWALHYI